MKNFNYKLINQISEDLYSQLPLSLYAEIGKTYYITFNGVNYECVAWNNGDTANIIGNGSIYGGEGQGEDVPFADLDRKKGFLQRLFRK